MNIQPRISVVIPAYRVSNSILRVISSIGPEVAHIYVVDDCCPENSGKMVAETCTDNRVQVLYHEKNLGVGAATMTGYSEAMKIGADVVVKLDGDGQMSPELILTLIAPILRGEADYSKGNRFDSLEDLEEMPRVRILGNAVLSLWSKFSSGYWRVNDPTNGFTAIHKTALAKLPLAKLSQRYFFESDMLFRLSVIGAVVFDVPMRAIYRDEVSNLKIRRVLWEFPLRHAVNLMKRIFYRYYLREWSIASFYIPFSFSLLTFGLAFGLGSFASASSAGRETSAGQATIAAVAIILGFQLYLSFLAYDVEAEPKVSLQRRTK